jgi:hypothetical protein
MAEDPEQPKREVRLCELLEELTNLRRLVVGTILALFAVAGPEPC